MHKSVRVVVSAALLVLFGVRAAPLFAGNEGQEDLDRATEVKLSADSIKDLGEVVRLLESALKKGLDETNADFARRLLSATLIQRATAQGNRIFVNLTSSDDFRLRRQAILSDLEKAVQLDPKQPQAYLLIAQMNLLPEGNAAKAREALDAALALEIEEPPLRAKALLLRSGLQEQAEKKLADLNEAVDLMPHGSAVFRARALVLAEMNRLDEALADLDQAIALDPEGGLAYEDKATVLIRQKKFEEALAMLEKARQLNPTSVEPWVKQARLHAQQNLPEAALEDLNQALAVAPNNLGVLLLRAGVHEEQGNREKALADVDAVLKLNPNFPVAIRTRALLLAADGRFDEAIAEWDKLLKLNPKDIVPLMEQARLLVQQKNFEAAVEKLNQAVATSPDHLGALLLRAGVHQEQGDLDKALADVDAALKLGPDLPVVLRTRALLLAEKKQFAEATKELEKIRRNHPQDLLTLMQLGLLYGVQKRMDAAIEAYTAFLAVEPDSWRALHGRADAYLNSGRHEQAIADYEKAVRLYPTDESLKKEPVDETLLRTVQSLLNNYAWVLATSPDDKLRDGRRAIELATEACKLSDYKAAYILSTLAAAYAETGDFDEAIRWSTKAVEIDDPNHGESLKKELESYKAKKPWRERMSENQPEEPAAEPEQSAGKTDKPAEIAPSPPKTP